MSRRITVVAALLTLAFVAPMSAAYALWRTTATATLAVSTASSCTSQSLTALADSWIDQSSPNANKGTDGTLEVRAKSPSNNMRALVRFAAPTVPAGCVLTTATLRLYVDDFKAGRTIQALRINAAWTETGPGGVTWNNQPATAGTAATSDSLATKNVYQEWLVTTQVQAMITAGAHHGFLVRDANENSGDNLQKYYAREKGSNLPQLVLTYGPAGP